MGRIVFFCQSCGARFEVDAAMAGKPGHCKSCGQKMAIPRASEVASMVAAPAVAAAANGAGGPGWLRGMTSNVALAPLTEEGIARLCKPAPKPSPLDDDSGPALYNLVESRKWVVPTREKGPRVDHVKVGWRRGLGTIQKVARWVNQSAYLVSIPFLMMILTGATLKNRPLALFGAVVVVLLNVGRIVSGLANLVLIPFRESPAQGVIFLVPPFTFLYLARNWQGMKRPLQRVVVPALTIGLVVLAFTFIPWLTRDGKGSTDWTAGGLRAGAADLRAEMTAQIDQAKALDLRAIEARGGAEFQRLKASLNEKIAKARRSAGPAATGGATAGTAPASGGSLTDLVGELQRLRDGMTDSPNP